MSAGDIAQVKMPDNPAKFFEPHRGFKSAKLDPKVKEALIAMGAQARGSAIKMTTVAGSGHPGGSMSSMEIYLLLYGLANLRPDSPWWEDRDRIIISHGHTSPGVYAALGHLGFFDVNQAEYSFRLAGSPFEGHVERSVPGVEWDTGNLGQGLSVACGKAVAARARGKSQHFYVVMGDGEQQKGQISEARRFALKYGLANITAIIDYNKLQISGSIDSVMSQAIADEWRAGGWQVVEVDGHDLDKLYQALYQARQDSSKPTVIMARTVMGKGYPAIENDHNYHGAPLKPDQATEAFAALGLKDSGYDNIAELKARRADGPPASMGHPPDLYPQVSAGEARTYPTDKATDNRSAWGAALVDLAEANSVGTSDGTPMVVYDCDLAVSVKTGDFEKKFNDQFYQSGISEHSVATCAGATSSEGVLTFWSDFGVFGVAETYNQNRLNDINDAHLKVVCTHCGLDVGEDGKTHQCIDYFGLSRSVFGWKLFTPADANQTDRIIRYIATQPGSFLVVMGRSKHKPIAAADGSPLFAGAYKFRPDRTDVLRQGEGLTIVCSGNMAPQALAAWEDLNASGAPVRLISSAHWADFHADDLKSIAAFGRIVTVEDHNVNNGLGMSLSAELLQAGLSARVTRLGVKQYGASGAAADVYQMMGLDGASIAAAARELLTVDAPAGSLASVSQV